MVIIAIAIKVSSYFTNLHKSMSYSIKVSFTSLLSNNLAPDFIDNLPLPVTYQGKRLSINANHSLVKKTSKNVFFSSDREVTLS